MRIAVFQKHQNTGDRRHLILVCGLCETDLGIGLIEKIEK